jgi:DNA-binding transcriptional ArsR family regulator
MTIDYRKDSEILKAMGHPVRLEILGRLKRNECCVNKLTDLLGVPQSTVSQHLGRLRSAGIIEPQKDGVKACYRIVEPRAKEILRILG